MSYNKLKRHAREIAGEDNIGYLSGIGESNNDPGIISSGKGEVGGKSYGAFQFASKFGVQKKFMYWLKYKNQAMYQKLNDGFVADGNASGDNFNNAWKEIAKNHPDEFLRLQYEYTKYNYYDLSAEKIKQRTGLDFNSRGYALKNVLWSRAVHHGPGGVVKVVEKALDKLDWKNATDEQIIRAIYAESGATDDKGGIKIVEENFSLKNREQYTSYAKKNRIYGKSMTYFGGNSADVQVGVWKRLNFEELERAIKLLKQYN